MLPVTSLLAVTLAAMFFALGVLTIRRRRSTQIAVGDGGAEPLTRAIRAQGNLFEYGTVFTALIALSELNGAPVWLIGALAAVFVVGRLSHAYGLLVAEADVEGGAARFRWRVRGMAITLTLIATTACILLAAVALNLLR